MKHKKATIDIETKHGTYGAVLKWDAKDKAYIVKVQSLPGVFTFGKNIRDAKKMAKDVIELYCDCLIREGNIIVDDKRKVAGSIPSHVIAVR